MAIKDWSTTAASNNSAPPNGAPEGWAPSSVNNVIREIMAQVRSWYEDPTWINFGNTYTYVSGTQFKIIGADKTAQYPVGRRVRAVGTTTGTIYGTVSVSAFSTDTTITVVWDSGSLASETLQVSAGLPSSGNPLTAAQISFSALTEDTSPDAPTDFVVTQDTSAGGVLKKALIINIFKALNTLTADATPDVTADYTLTYDNSAGTVKKVLLNKLFLTVVSCLAGIIKSPAAQDYRLWLNIPFAFTIKSTTTRCGAGTATATFKINTTVLGGTANSVSTSEQEQTHSSSNVGAVGDDIVMTLSSVSSCTDLSFNVKFERSLV